MGKLSISPFVSHTCCKLNLPGSLLALPGAERIKGEKLIKLSCLYLW